MTLCQLGVVIKDAVHNVKAKFKFKVTEKFEISISVQISVSTSDVVGWATGRARCHNSQTGANVYLEYCNSRKAGQSNKNRLCNCKIRLKETGRNHGMKAQS